MIGNRLQGLREFDDANLAFAFGDFKLGDTRFSHEVDQGFEFSEVHRSCFPIVFWPRPYFRAASDCCRCERCRGEDQWRAA
ncbi:Uncharacterised protein [Bordetella pertussis]|nr:Uncharacterised protein [Bordetella pertussis]